jgi:arginine-tRNA-protein transferase
MTKHDSNNEQQHQSNNGVDDPIQRLSFFATPEHECSYLPDRQAITLFADPNARFDNHMYSILAQYGFRRSGRHIYRPSCPACEACIPVRVPVDEFQPNRSQRRNWNRNHDLSVRELPSEFNAEHHVLYCKYIEDRHPAGGMDDPDPEKYMEFLTCEWSETRFIEFRLNGQLASVAVVDELDSGFSAVYTFFDPALAKRGLGTYAILWEIEASRRQGLPWLYLGYWIEACPKMRYKMDYSPLEKFHQGCWNRI